jgi:hypothetical protein
MALVFMMISFFALDFGDKSSFPNKNDNYNKEPDRVTGYPFSQMDNANLEKTPTMIRTFLQK